MARRRRTRISYAPKSRRKSSASSRTLTTSPSNVQDKEQETVKPKSKQKNRIVYKPKVRRKTSAGSTASENASSNEQEAKEATRRNKRRSSGTLMTANKQQFKVLLN